MLILNTFFSPNNLRRREECALMHVSRPSRQGGEHMTFEGFPALRLQASASRKSCTYRYKSLADGRMRQVKPGEWPAMAFAAAIAAWERNRVERDSGAELSALRRKPRARISLTKIQGEIPVPTNLPAGCTFHPRCARAMPECSSRLPPLEEMGASRSVACFFPSGRR